MAKLTTTRMTDATKGNLIDNKVGELESDLAAIFGVPLETVIAVNSFIFTADGLDIIEFVVPGGDPGPAQMRRNADGYARYNNGGYIGKLAPLPPAVKMPFYTDTAPIGWTRIVDAYYNDRMIRIVTGAQADGGSWTISGLSDGGHVHGLGNHVHYANHQHDMSNHVHADDHTHTVEDSGTTFEPHPGNQLAKGGAVQTGPRSLPNTGIPNTNLTSTSDHGDNTSTPIPNVSDSAVNQVISDGAWRPLHLDMILCENNA